MIRRNVASQVIYLPQLVLAADGTAVTSSATLTVAKDGVESVSAGTLAHSANGVWKYTPTQGETDAAIVGLILTGTSAVPVVLNLITTAADTSAVALGANTAAPLDAAGTRSAIGLGTANLDTQLSGVQADTNDIQTRLPAALESGRIAAALGSTATDALVDAIWNEVLTGATHNIASSAGRRLRQLADTVVLADGECDAASNAGTDSTGTITLEVGTTTACVGQAIRCENQVRFIASYDAGTRIAQLDRPWCVVPDAGDEYVIFNVRNPLVGLASLALAGSTAAAVNDILVDTGVTLPAAIAAIDGGLTGDYTLTVTVTDADDSAPIENATVTLSRTGERGAELTNSSGVAVVGLDAATWSWIVRAAGYESRTGTVVVSANGTLAVELDGIVVDTAESPLCAVVLPVVNQYGVRIAGVSVSFKFAGLQTNAVPGAVIMSPPPTLTSGVDGTVSVNLIRLARYTATYKIDSEIRNIAIAVPNAGSFTVVDV
jgi:hypothetical protein